MVMEPMTGLWEHTEPNLMPSSNLWDEAEQKIAATELKAQYGGGVAIIRPGERYFTDSAGRVLVGWHGTTNPPSGMDGYSMIKCVD